MLPALEREASTAAGARVGAGISAAIVRIERGPPGHDILAAERERYIAVVLRVQEYERRTGRTEGMQIEEHIVLADERSYLVGIGCLGVSLGRVIVYYTVEIRVRLARHGGASGGIGYRHERDRSSQEDAGSGIQLSDESRYRLGAGRLVAVYAAEYEDTRPCGYSGISDRIEYHDGFLGIIRSSCRSG